MANRITLAATAALAAVFLLTMGAPVALADIATFTLGTGNPGISGYAGPYATVTINRTDSTHATITFTSDTVGGNMYRLGDGGSVGVNVNGSFSLGAINGYSASSLFTPGPFSSGSGNEDGFGSFNLTITDSDGMNNSADQVVFTLSATGTNSWASAENVLKPNEDGYSVAAHIFVWDGGSTPQGTKPNGALATGFAADGGTSVPDGGVTLMLLGGVLVGLETLRRKLSA